MTEEEKKFLEAVRKGDVETVSAALKQNPELIDYRDMIGSTVMHEAAAARKIDMINFLNEKNPELLTMPNEAGATPRDMAKITEQDKGTSIDTVLTPNQAGVTTGVEPPAQPAPDPDAESKDKGFDWRGILANPMVLGLGAGLIGMLLTGGSGILGMLIPIGMALAAGFLAPAPVRDLLSIPHPDHAQLSTAEEKALDGVGVSKTVNAPTPTAEHGAEKPKDKVAKADDNEVDMKAFGDHDANITLGEFKKDLSTLNLTNEQALDLAKRIGSAAAKDGVTYTPANGALSDETVVLTLDAEKGTDVKLQVDKKLQVTEVPTGEAVTPNAAGAPAPNTTEATPPRP